MLRQPPAMLAFFLPFPLLQCRMLHRKKSSLLSRSSGQRSQELISEREKTQNLMDFSRGEISSKGRATPGCCLATPWLIHGLCLLIKIRCTQPPKQGKTHCKFRELLLWPGSCRMWGSPVQTETDGEGGKTRSLSLCPHYAPFLSANTESLLLSHCAYAHPSPCSHLLIPATSHQGHRVPQYLRQRQSSWV